MIEKQRRIPVRWTKCKDAVFAEACFSVAPNVKIPKIPFEFFVFPQINSVRKIERSIH